MQCSHHYFGIGILVWDWYPRLGLVSSVGIGILGWDWYPRLGLVSPFGIGIPVWDWYPRLRKINLRPGGWGQNMKINEKGREEVYLVHKVDQ